MRLNLARLRLRKFLGLADCNHDQYGTLDCVIGGGGSISPGYHLIATLRARTLLGLTGHSRGRYCPGYQLRPYLSSRFLSILSIKCVNWFYWADRAERADRADSKESPVFMGI